jgi:hypothetical protein
MITRREDVFSRDFDQARQLGERRTLMVIGMAKTQINCVPLVI